MTGPGTAEARNPAAGIDRECRGLPAEWINGWLAAVGATCLDPDMTLRWAAGPVPTAVLGHPRLDPDEAIATAWPDLRRLLAMPIARTHENCPAECPPGKKPGHCKEQRALAVESFHQLADTSRGRADAWTLTSTHTDLASDKGRAAHAQFDPAGPGSTGWLHHRLLKTWQHLPADPSGLRDAISSSLDGTAQLASDNGLGFDISRLNDKARSGDKLDNLIDPTAEVLAFFALELLPVRGDGIAGNSRARQRGHGIGSHSNGVFAWPAWSQQLDRWGIDALLDAWHRTWKLRKTRNGPPEWRTNRSDWDRLGVHAGWHTLPYKATVASDTTRGFASVRIHPHTPRRRQRPAPQRPAGMAQ